MAVLNNADRLEALRHFLTTVSSERDIIPGLSKDQLLAALGGLDDYVNANAAAINTAIPQPARGALSPSQKARLLQFVVQQRYIKGA